MSTPIPEQNRGGGSESTPANIFSRFVSLVTGKKSPQDNAPAPLDLNTQLSIERTMLAHERTLMAWVRTATSLITFGFTIYKFFQLEAKGRLPVSQVIGPRSFAFMMILMGLFALVIATLQYRANMKKHGATVSQRSLAGLVAGMMSIVGLVAMFSVIFDW